MSWGAIESFVELHAYFDALHYEHGVNGLEEGEKGFDASEFYLMISNRLHENLRFDAELEWEHGGSEFAARRLDIQWAIADWLKFDFGKFYAPVGREADIHYAPINRLVSRPLVSRYIVPGTWPEIGAMAGGDLDLGGVGISYRAAAVNGLAGPTRDDRQDNDNNDEMALAGRFEVSPVDWLSIGVSGYRGTYDPRDRYLIVIRGADAALHYQGLTAITEYLDSQVEIPGTTVNRTGYYALVSYRINGNVFPETAKGNPPLNYIEPAVRFDHLDEASRLEPLSGVPDVDRLSAGISVSPMPHFQLKAEYQWLWISSPEADTRGNTLFQAVVDF